MHRIRFTIYIFVCLAVSLLVFSGCAKPASETPTAAPTQPPKRTLVVGGWGGLWEESFLKCVAKPFEASHPGVEIVHFIQPASSEMVVKVRAEIDRPPVDIVGCGAGWEVVYADEGLVVDFDLDKMPNLRDMYPVGIYKNRVAANSFNALGLAYHKERVPRKPDSWYDLWDPAFGKVAISEMSNSAGYNLFWAINQLEGGTKEDLEPGWKKYEELVKTISPSVIRNISADAVNFIVQQDGVMTVAGCSRIVGLMKEGYPVGFVYPKEGALFWGNYLGVVKNSQNQDLAMEFINFWLDPEVDGCFGASVNYGPGNKESKFPADYEYHEFLLTAEGMDKARPADWQYLTGQVPEWVERWTTEILPLFSE